MKSFIGRMNCHPAIWCLLAAFLGVSAAVAQEKPAAEPDWARADEQVRIANQKLAEGKNEEAAAAFEAADRLALGQSCSAVVALAAVQGTLERMKEAEQTAKRVLAQEACSHERGAALHVLGLALFRSGDGQEPELRQAIAAFEESIRLGGPSLDSSRLLLAHAHNLLGESGKAAHQLRELLASLPAEHDTAKDGRILLCLIRSRHPELRPEVSASIVADAAARNAERIVRNPEKLSTPPPDYPAAPGLFAGRPRGRVYIQANVDQEGCVVETKIVKSDAVELEPAAREKVAEWTYLPATLNGVAIPFLLNLTVDFKKSE